MTTSRQPLKPLRDFLRHISTFCFRSGDVRDKRFYQKVVLKYCNAELPNWHDSGDHDGVMLQRHATYWRTLQRDDGTPCRLAEWIHLLISNREQDQTAKRWAVNITGCLVDRTYQLIPPEECYGIRLGDGTAFGPGHERILYDSLQKYMGGQEIANYIFEHGVPRIFDYDTILDSTPSTRTKLLREVLHWWMNFLRDHIVDDHNIPKHDGATFGKTENLRSRPNVFRAAPYKITTSSQPSWHDSWRQGQSGEWLWLEDGRSTAG